MFARTIYARERFFMKQADKPMPVSSPTENVHYKHIVIYRQIHVLKHWSKLKLSRSYFVMTCLYWNAEPPKLVLRIVHKVKHTLFYRTEIMVVKLLMFRGSDTEKCSFRLQKIRSVKVEIFLKKFLAAKFFYFY